MIVMRRLLPLLCLLSGAALTLAFSPFNLWWLALVLPAILCASWLNVSPRQAFLRGWLFGFGLAITGGSWVYVSMHVYGGDSAFAAIGATVLLSAALGLYPAVQGYLFTRFFPKGHLRIILAFPALWVASEWLRTYLFTGIPWLLLGNTQINTPFSGYAPIDSVYLVSLVIALINALLVAVFCYKGIRAYLCLTTILALTLLGWTLKSIQWTNAISKPISIAIMQGNIPQQTKWDPGAVEATLEKYATLTTQHWNAPLIFWPENAVPLLSSDATPFTNELDQEAKQHHTAILFGMPMAGTPPDTYYNAATVVGNGRGTYYKHHLVPFGEYIPLRRFFGKTLGFLSLPMTDFSAGPEIQPLLDMQNLHVALFICFESAFPEAVKAQLQEANLMVTISDDGWFGHSLGPYQHEEIDQMRALETGRYLVRATNNGLTSIINTQGKIVSQAPMDKTLVLTGTIIPVNGETPWMYFGLFPLICLVLLMLLIAWLNKP
jgi:apolipoprotein N-acyltransferase